MKITSNSILEEIALAITVIGEDEIEESYFEEKYWKLDFDPKEC